MCSTYTMDLDQPESPSFSLFSKLPPELRLRIWKYSLPDTRIVPVRCGQASLSLESAPSRSSSSSSSPPPPPSSPTSLVAATSCTTTTPSPANLHICAESRAEASKSYTRCFGFARQKGHMYFDPDSDVLYFGPRRGYMAADAQFRTFLALCEPAELAAVRRVAISDSLFWIDDTYRSMTAASLTLDVLRLSYQYLPNLEELIFVPREEDEEDARGGGGGQNNVNLVLQRIQAQVFAAMNTVSQQVSPRTLPAWYVMTLQALHNAAG